MRNIFLAGTIFMAASTAAFAQEAGRFTLEKTAEGYVRMDRQTGEMSICTERSGQLVCKLAADERSAFETELDRIVTRLDGLEKRLAAVESQPVRVPDLPSDEEIERSLGYMEKFFRRFMEVVKDFDKDIRSPEPSPVPPQKT